KVQRSTQLTGRLKAVLLLGEPSVRTQPRLRCVEILGKLSIHVQAANVVDLYGCLPGHAVED
ncbi:MAG: hypothetical protein ACKPKO_50285, partial [Candidatus Fonsibacter sp.]